MDITSVHSGEAGKVVEQKVPPSRGGWGKHLEFVLTIVGYAVGLGNLWRFPYLCYQHGGGTFIIPYLLMLAVLGLPIFYFELCLGQFSGRGPTGVWKMSPIFRGVGFAATANIWMIGLYYNIVITWGWRYLFASLTSKLPWTDCTNDWNSQACLVGPELKALRESGNLTQWMEDRNITSAKEIKTPSEEFFYNEVLEISAGFEHPGSPIWKLVLCLALSWLICFLALMKGVRSMGKSMYFVTVFPYIMMTVLVVRGLTLEGAMDGVIAYLQPDFTAMSDAAMWSNAATQIFYTLGTCSGGLIALASYNSFNNNIQRDALIVPGINGLTSLYAGFAVFSVLGFMANTKGLDVKDVATDGPGLVFVVYPEALSQMPAPPVWSVLFFIMLISLGYSSVFSMVETPFIVIMDLFPYVLRKNKWRPLIFRGVSISIFFLMTLAMVTNGGFYLFDICDTFISGFPMLIIGLTQFIAVMYVYGYNRWADDIAMMLGKRPSVFFKVCWMGVSPLLLFVIIVSKAVAYSPPTFGSYVYPSSANAVGWLQVTFCVGWIPAIAVYYVCRHARIFDSIRFLSKPTPEWGPVRPEDRTGAYAPTKLPPDDLYAIPDLVINNDQLMTNNDLLLTSHGHNTIDQTQQGPHYHNQGPNYHNQGPNYPNQVPGCPQQDPSYTNKAFDYEQHF